MKFEQRDIVLTSFYDGRQWKERPTLIVSNNELQEAEDLVYIAMISTKDYNPQYSYKLTQEMYSGTLDKQSYVKCHLLEFDATNGIVKKIGRMRQPYFDEIVEKIKESIF